MKCKYFKWYSQFWLCVCHRNLDDLQQLPENSSSQIHTDVLKSMDLERVCYVVDYNTHHTSTKHGKNITLKKKTFGENAHETPKWIR